MVNLLIDLFCFLGTKLMPDCISTRPDAYSWDLQVCYMALIALLSAHTVLQCSPDIIWVVYNASGRNHTAAHRVFMGPLFGPIGTLCVVMLNLCKPQCCKHLPQITPVSFPFFFYKYYSKWVTDLKINANLASIYLKFAWPALGCKSLIPLQLRREVDYLNKNIIVYLMSWIAPLRSLFLPHTFREFTSRITNSPFFIPMVTISPLGL